LHLRNFRVAPATDPLRFFAEDQTWAILQDMAKYRLMKAVERIVKESEIRNKA
jgi:hypothetical protein